MKSFDVCAIAAAACLFFGGCVSSAGNAGERPAPEAAPGGAPFAAERVIPFDGNDPESARFEISLDLADPAPRSSQTGRLVRELLYEGKSAAGYGQAVIAEQEELYAALRAEWIPQGGAQMASFNWYYKEKAESREVSVKGFIPGRETLLVLTKTTDSFKGGAHGNYVTSCFVVDPAAGRRLAPDDIFSGTEELRLLLEAELRRRYHLPEGAPLSQAGFFEDRIELPENFFPEREERGDSLSMRFLWNAYDIAPYVMGAIEVSLPFKSLSPLLRK